MQVNRGQNVGDLGRSNVEFSEQFDFSTSRARVNLQLSRDRDEVFLEDLQRHYSSSGAPVLGD